jgi:outer membrane protein TolC
VDGDFVFAAHGPSAQAAFQLPGSEENVMKGISLYRLAAALALTVLPASPQNASAVRRLSLKEAVQLALSQNRSLRIARLRVTENEHQKAGERSAYFPSLTNQSNIIHFTNLQNIDVPAGALGTVGAALVPGQNVVILQGQNTIYSTGTMVSQPLTQLFRIHAQNQIAAAQVSGSKDDLQKAENDLALQVHSLYFEVLITGLQKQAALQQTKYADENLRESEDDIRNGSALRVAAIKGRAGVLEGQQAVLTADLQLDDLTTELDNLLGLPLDTRLELDPNVPADFDPRPREEYVQTAWSQNPEVLSAQDAVKKARAAVTAAKTAYIPDITAYARQSYQDGAPFLLKNFGEFGIHMNWTVFDFGKRRSEVRTREDQLAEAEENLRRMRDDVATAIEKTYNKLEKAKSMVVVANQVVELRKESERLAQNQLVQGEALISARSEAAAATYKAQADYLQARLGYLLACAELQQRAGITPGL